MAVTLTLDLQVAKAIQGLASVIAKEDQFDQAILKTIGLTREHAKANAELVASHKQANELAIAFKKQETVAIEAYKRALIEEGQLDIKIAKDKRHADEQLAAQKKASIDSYKRELIAEAQLDIRIARDRREADEKKTAAFVSNRDKERRSWQSFVNEVKSLNTNPLEAFAARQEKLNTALKAGAISQQDFNRETARMHAELNPAIQETTKSAMSFNDVMVAGGTAASVYSLVRQQLDGVKESLRGAREEAQKALQGQQGQQISDKQLLEVSTSEADFHALRAAANRVAVEHGIPLDKAKGLVYHARNYGDDSPESIAALARTNVLSEDTSQTSRLVGQFKLNFAHEKLTTAQITEMVAAAARHGPSNFGDYADTFGPASVMAGSVGATSDETLAVQSAFTAKFGSPQTAAKRLNIILQRIHQHRDQLGNVQGLRANILALENLEKENPELVEKEFESRMETTQAYEALKSPEGKKFIAETLSDIQASRKTAGTTASGLAMRERIRDRDPLLAAGMAVTQSEVALQLAEQRLVPREAANEAAVNLAKKALLNQTGLIGPFRQRAYKFMEQVRDWAGFDGSPVSPEGIGFSGVSAGAVYGGGMNPLNPKSRSAVGAALGATNQYLKDVDRKTPSEQLEKTNSLLQTLIDRLPPAIQAKVSRVGAQAQALLQAN